MKNYLNDPEMPMGLGMALAQNLQAMERFTSLPPAHQQALIQRSHEMHSRRDMRRFVSEFGERQDFI